MTSWGTLEDQAQVNVVHRYLDELQGLLRANPNGPLRESALDQMRHRVRKDLMLGNLGPQRYRTLEQRIAEPLAKARATAIQDAFQELPQGLLVRLEVLLEDGILEADEYDLFIDIVQRADLPGLDLESLKMRLQRWVREDRPMA